MKSFSLALFAGAISAVDVWHGGYHNHPPIHGYKNPWEQQHAVQQKQQGYNPWHKKTHTPTKPNGWYSATLQYSPPKIPFVPFKLHKTTYGICEIEDDMSPPNTITVNLGQVPGYATVIQGEISGTNLTAADGEVWSFTVNQFGNVSGMNCENVGKEFNPLTEYVYGQPNPYSDPSRGAIDSVTIAAADASVTTQMFNQSKFMQNLGGKNSLIGKSIKVTTMRNDISGMPAEALIGCCVIGQADNPANANAANNAHPSHAGYGHHGHHGHSHGVYGGFRPSYTAPPSPHYGYGGYRGW